MYFSCVHNVWLSRDFEKIERDVIFSTHIENKKLIDSLKLVIVMQGDVKAYNLAHSYFELEEKTWDFLYYSIIMANKYKNADACYDVFWTLAQYEIDHLDSLDFQTKNIAMYYLLKSHELGNNQAIYHIESIFGSNENPPNSEGYLREMPDLN